VDQQRQIHDVRLPILGHAPMMPAGGSTGSDGPGRWSSRPALLAEPSVEDCEPTSSTSGCRC
jgi:hypothetical protein